MSQNRAFYHVKTDVFNVKNKAKTDVFNVKNKAKTDVFNVKNKAKTDVFLFYCLSFML